MGTPPYTFLSYSVYFAYDPIEGTGKWESLDLISPQQQGRAVIMELV